MTDQESTFDEEVERIDGNVEGLWNTVGRLETKIDQLSERVDQQQYVIDQLVTDLPTQTLTKREKKAKILKRVAKDAPGNVTAGSITRDKAAGAADCSGRHARTLFQELASSWGWATYKPDGDPQARLAVKFGDGGAEAFLEQLAEIFPEVRQE